MSLPVDTAWYAHEKLNARIWLITEPRVHPIWSANIHLVLGQDADLVIDTGMGIAPLKPVIDALRLDAEKPVICLSTHAHIDHIGAVHEFDTRLVHPLEEDDMASPGHYSLRSSTISDAARALFASVGYAELWPLLIDAIPHAGYAVDSYVLRGAASTGTVQEGDRISLGDWEAEVLHLPGHSPGQVGLFHHESGTLFGADAVYDGPLIYEGPGTDMSDYAQTLRRLRELPVKIVHGGHDPAFPKSRLDEMIEHYLPIFES